LPTVASPVKAKAKRAAPKGLKRGTSSQKTGESLVGEKKAELLPSKTEESTVGELLPSKFGRQDPPQETSPETEVVKKNFKKKFKSKRTPASNTTETTDGESGTSYERLMSPRVDPQSLDKTPLLSMRTTSDSSVANSTNLTNKKRWAKGKAGSNPPKNGSADQADFASKGSTKTSS
jgi:hypothetical protein